MKCYNQDLQISYQNEQTVISDVLDLNDLNQELHVFHNPRRTRDADGTRQLPPDDKKAGPDLWMEHWIDVYNSRTAAEKRADKFWRTEFPAKRHRFKKQKVRFADGTKTTSAHRVLQTANLTSLTDTSRARVGGKGMTSLTSTTTSTSQRQLDQGSTCDLELGKLMGARTNTRSLGI